MLSAGTSEDQCAGIIDACFTVGRIGRHRAAAEQPRR